MKIVTCILKLIQVMLLVSIANDLIKLAKKCLKL